MYSIIYFGAEWCPYCKELKPEIESLRGVSDKFMVATVDVGNRENAKKYKETHGLKCLPSVIVYKGLDEQTRWDADMDITFQDFIKPYIQ